MENTIANLIANYGVPVMLVAWILWKAPDIFQGIQGALDRNTAIIERNNKILIIFATKLDCKEELESLLQEAQNVHKTTS